MQRAPVTDTIEKADLLVLGGGLVGMTLALAAASKGLSTHLVDRADPADLTAEGFDGRASAISTASWRLFRNIGLEEALEPHGCDIAAIAVMDQMKAGRLDFRPVAAFLRGACRPVPRRSWSCQCRGQPDLFRHVRFGGSRCSWHRQDHH